MGKPLLSGVIAGMVAVMVPGAVSAHRGPPVAVFTDIVRATEVVPFEGPCGGGAGTVSIEFHDKFHVTAFADGHVVMSANQVGTFEFEPSDPDEPNISGRYRNGFTSTFAQNSETETSVFNVVGRDENGERVRFQVRTHFTVANGEVKVETFTVKCA